jgi:hypothetical protein
MREGQSRDYAPAARDRLSAWALTGEELRV